MKLIDEKGRIFSVINVIDLAAAILLLIFIPMAFFGYKAAITKIPVVIQEEKVVKVQVRFEKVDPRVSPMIKAGDIEDEPSWEGKGRILKVASVATENSYKQYVTVDMELTCSKKGGALYYKGYLVRPGVEVPFLTNRYYVKGVILEVNSI